MKYTVDTDTKTITFKTVKGEELLQLAKQYPDYTLQFLNKEEGNFLEVYCDLFPMYYPHRAIIS